MINTCVIGDSVRLSCKLDVEITIAQYNSFIKFLKETNRITHDDEAIEYLTDEVSKDLADLCVGMEDHFNELLPDDSTVYVVEV